MLLDYGRDIEASIQASCEGADFDEALRNATLYSRQDLVQSSIAPSVLDHTDSLMESMSELRGQVEKQQSRIAELDILRQQDIGEPCSPHVLLHGCKLTCGNQMPTLARST